MTLEEFLRVCRRLEPEHVSLTAADYRELAEDLGNRVIYKKVDGRNVMSVLYDYDKYVDVAVRSGKARL